MIYLDYAASSPPYAEVCRLVGETMAKLYADPGSVHSAAASAQKILRESRQTMAKLLRFPDSCVYFTSGGTESNNTALISGALSTGRQEIVVAASEHPSVLEPVKQLQGLGFRVKYVYPDADGIIDLGDIEAALSHETALVSVQAVNGETGAVQNTDEIYRMAHRFGALYHCDAALGFGHFDIFWHNSDMISLSAHKFGGPKGVGVLAVKDSVMLEPFLRGGGQEFGLRSGSENVPGIAGMALAAELSAKELTPVFLRIQNMNYYIINTLREHILEVEIRGEFTPRYPGILNIRIPGISGEEMCARLDSKGICVSPGSSCGVRDNAPSHVLLSMGLSEQQAKESFRISMGRLTTEEEVETAVKEIIAVASQK